MSGFKKKPKVTIIDTGTSNLRSVYYALKKNNCEPNILKNNDNFKENIDGLVVPGVGAFFSVIDHLKKNNLDKTIYNVIEKNIPAMFICVGMQVLFTESHEFGTHKGLNILKGKIKKIPQNINEKENRNVPMIGWNKIELLKENNVLKKQKKNFYYFTHSFYAEADDMEIMTSNTKYLNFNYCASVNYKKIHAFQFHPEKSGEEGLKIYENFVNLI
jgi:glutamine amidotransferase